MKNRSWLLYTIPFILIAAMILCFFWVREEMFPEAPEIEVPEREDILMASVSSVSADMDVVVEISAGEWEAVLTLLENSTPTRRQSVNDTPSVRPYYEFILKTEKRMYSYFVYLEDGQVWLEMPYTGIYRTVQPLLTLAKSYTLP